MKPEDLIRAFEDKALVEQYAVAIGDQIGWSGPIELVPQSWMDANVFELLEDIGSES